MATQKRLKQVDSATYVYCVVRDRSPSLAGAPKGLPGASALRLIDAGAGLFLVACDAPLELYGEAAIDKGLKDLDWVSRCALAHEQVVEHFRRAEAMLPLKLFTLFLSDARALEFVAADRKRIEGVLKRVKGCVELGLRVTFDPKRSAKTAKPAEAVASGAAFLMRKKVLRESEREATREALNEVEAVFEVLEKKAARATRREPTQGKSGGPRLVLDAAFLVPVKSEGAFRKSVSSLTKSLEQDGYEITVTGPWPPYNFVADAA